MCGVDTDDSGWLYYDSAGGIAYGECDAGTNGAQYASQPLGLVDNLWREPDPSHGPIMSDWYGFPSYAKEQMPAQSDYICEYVKIKYPNGGEEIGIGTTINIQFYTAGLQGYEVEVAYNDDQGNSGVISTVAIGEEASEAANFSKLNNVSWDTTGLPSGSYRITAKVVGSSESDYEDETDSEFEMTP